MHETPRDPSSSAVPSDPWQPAEPPPDVMAEQILSVEAAPEEGDRWDRLEELAERHQRPDVVEALYGRLLERARERALAEALGTRAVRFHDEWSGEAQALERLLRAVLRVDVGIEWAFERLTMSLTMGERWGELLSLYDQALAATTDLLRRREMLDEAAHVAKDFAGQPDRAIDYLWQLLQLRPSDGALAGSLERLLEAKGRHRELVRLWELRAGVLEGEASKALRLRTALCWLEQVGEPAEAVRTLEPLLGERYEQARVVTTLERIAAQSEAPDDARAKAYGLLEAHFEREGQEREVLRVLEGALVVVATPHEGARLHRKAAALYELHNDERKALGHLSKLVPLEPLDEGARGALRKLGERTGEWALVARALAGAAEALGSQAGAVELQEEAATLLLERVEDRAEAARLYLQVFWAPEAGPERAQRVGERLWREQLLGTEQANEFLPVLERLVELGPSAEELLPGPWRHELLGEVARVARALGHHERALRAWDLRLLQDGNDHEAADGRIDALEQLRRWEPLLSALRARSERVTSEEERRRDLVRIAKVVAATVGDVDRAIEAWREIEANFGRESDTVDALADLYARAGRGQELAMLLAEAEAQAAAGARRAELRAWLGELQQEPQGRLDLFVASLADEPGCQRARAGLWKLLDDEATGALALSGLVDACYRTDDWRELLRLTEHRLLAASDEESKAAVLVEAAQLEEARAGNAAAAQQMLGRALELTPGKHQIELDVLRLAEQTGQWAEAASALAHALASAVALETMQGTRGRSQELQARLGDVLEHRLHDLPRAFGAYRQVMADDPAFSGIAGAVVRVGAQLKLYREVVDALGQEVQRLGHLPPSLSAVAEANVTTVEGWEALVEAMQRAAEASGAAAPLQHALYRQLGLWLRDRLADPARAEQALARAVVLDPTSVHALEELAELQRRRPDLSLVETLRLLSTARGGDEVALREAAELALDQLGDETTGLGLLAALLDVARRHWQLPTPPPTPEPPRWYVGWALDRLVSLRERRGEAAQAVELLVEGARLPFEQGEVLVYLHRAALLARSALDDSARAAALYRDALALSPADAAALGALAEIYQKSGLTQELIGLRRHELGLDLPLERRLEVRLDLAQAAARLGDEAQRVEALRDNLRERPGHPASIVEVTAALTAAGKLRELTSLLVEQADTLERLGEFNVARTLWLRAADIAENQLSDPSEAIAAQRRAVAIASSPDVLDALGRLHLARGEPSAAIPWLEARLEGSSADERADVVLRLASALAGAGRSDEARRHLEKVHAQAPQHRAVRSQLASLYRASQSWPELVSLALTAADHEEDTQARLGLYLEAADVLLRRSNDPARAVDLLRRASALAPQDRGLRAGLADALRSAGQLDEAQKLLEELLNEYGRRRPPERSAVHFQLAQLAQARGDLTEALGQLDTASSMDMAHGGVLLLLGQLAAGSGQLERAERAFRALLLTLRRQRPDGPSSHLVDIGPSEVIFELYRIATRLQQPERASELLESAFEAAAQNPAEAARLERALRDNGDDALLLRALSSRRDRAATPPERSAALVDLACAHERLGHFAEAFEAAAQALVLTPDADPVHKTARRLARQGLGPRYADALRALAAQSPAEQAAALWLRLGAFHELDDSDCPRAVEAYERAFQTGVRGVDACLALERVSAAAGDRPRQLTALRSLVELLADEPEPVALVNALYRLSALELGDASSEAQGVATLTRAIDLAPRLPEALALLRAAAARSTSRDLLALYERVARSAADDDALLDAFERLAAARHAHDELLREAVALADRLAQPARAEALLRAAADASSALWALVELGQRARAAGAFGDAHAWLLRASEATSGDEAFRLGLEASALAADQLKNPTLAAQLYDRFWRQRPGAREAWEPLLALLRQGGDEDALDAVLAGAAAASDDPASRRRLRMERAEALLASAFRQDDAIGVLQEMLDEDPTDSDAQGLLLGLYERTGRADELASLLRQQLDAARDRRDLDAVSSLSLRLGGLLARRRRDDALDVYRRALDLLPDDPVLLREHLALLGPEGDPTERASVLERLLRDDAAADGARLASQLADARAASGDDDGVEAALKRGLVLSPDDDPLRQRLEQFYSASGRFRPLVEMLEHEASQQLDPADGAARLHKAATILREQLRDPRAAAALLRRARSLADDSALLRSLVDALLDAGDLEGARGEVAAALERTHVDNAARSQLLRLNARLALHQGQEADAAAALEQALALGDADAAPELLDALERLRQAAARRADLPAERASTLRLADLFLQHNQAEQGLALLHQWASRQPSDQEALRKLLDLEAAASHWPAVIDLCNRLIAADESEGRAEIALKLADACSKEGRPADARPGLEQAFASFPKNVPVRNALKQLYEQLGAQRELADILLHEAADLTDEAARFEPYRRAAELYIATGHGPNAVPVLEAALHSKPNDHDCTLLLADAYITMNQLEQATALLDAAIAGHKNKRSPQLSMLQYRMARVALAAGDRTIESAWLGAALESDSQNGQVAAELADVATELGQYDLALKALRAVTMMKNPGPMSKGMAFYRQGLIAYHQSDPRKAVLLAKRGLQEDPNLAEARTFLEQMGEKV